jgi:hypothetical protein
MVEYHTVCLTNDKNDIRNLHPRMPAGFYVITFFFCNNFTPYASAHPAHFARAHAPAFAFPRCSSILELPRSLFTTLPPSSTVASKHMRSELIFQKIEGLLFSNSQTFIPSCKKALNILWHLFVVSEKSVVMVRWFSSHYDKWHNSVYPQWSPYSFQIMFLPLTRKEAYLL